MLKKIKRIFLISCFAAGLISCSGASSSSDSSVAKISESTKMALPDISGQWIIENVVENDSSYVRPSEIEPAVVAYMDFKDDGSFGVITNCNHIGGHFSRNDGSIRLSDVSATEMACDNMELEEMLKKVLPLVSSIDCINDSITRLNSDVDESYIVLRKSNLFRK